VYINQIHQNSESNLAIIDNENSLFIKFSIENFQIKSIYVEMFINK
jgi:hypothetical protein